MTEGVRFRSLNELAELARVRAEQAQREQSRSRTPADSNLWRGRELAYREVAQLCFTGSVDPTASPLVVDAQGRVVQA